MAFPRTSSTDFRCRCATNRAQFYRDLPEGPFYGFNRPGVEPIPGIIDNWWRQGMMGSAKAHYDGIVAFSQTDFTEDLQGNLRTGTGHSTAMMIRSSPMPTLDRCRRDSCRMAL